MGPSPLLLAAATATVASASGRQAMFWLVPYENLTSVSAYTQAWSQWSTNWRAGYIAAGSAYAMKQNGTLGYADTTAGEGLYGDIMEKFGFPAMKALNMTPAAMVYMTHYAGLKILLSNATAATDFIDSAVNKALEQGLQGLDVDYEPQNVAQAVADIRAEAQAAGLAAAPEQWSKFLTQFAAAMSAHGLFLSIDIGGDCSGLGSCGVYGTMPGLLQMNTEDTFGIGSLSDFQSAVQANMDAGLGQRWAPGFEPGNIGQSLYSQVLKYAAGTANVTRIATWEVHECNVGPQPQWLFDVINAFLDTPL